MKTNKYLEIKKLIDEEIKQKKNESGFDAENLKSELLKGLGISPEEYAQAENIPLIRKIVDESREDFSSMLPDLEDLKSKIEGNFPIDYSSITSKPDLEAYRYNDSQLKNEMGKMGSVLKKHHFTINHLSQRMPKIHSHLEGISPDDHHIEKHTLESHLESDLLVNLYRLTSNEIVDDLHKHIDNKVSKEVKRNSGLWNPSHQHNELYYLKAEVVSLIAAGGGGGLSAVVDDLTPQLGGDLDGQAFDITTTGTISGINVTSGADPGHTHTAYETSGAVATHAALLTGVHGLAITAGKTLTVQDNVTITGALGTGAYATIANYALVGQQFYIGSTQVAINRASAALVLTGITSIDGASATCSGNAATATKLAATKTINGVAFDGSANITAPQGFPTAVNAYLSGSDQNINNTTYTKIALNGEVLDANSEFDSATNYRFTPTVAGTYAIYGQIWCPPGAGKFMIAAIYKTGANIAEMKTVIDTTDYSGSGVFTICSLETTDYIELYAYQNSGGALGILAGAKSTFLTIFRIA